MLVIFFANNSADCVLSVLLFIANCDSSTAFVYFNTSASASFKFFGAASLTLFCKGVSERGLAALFSVVGFTVAWSVSISQGGISVSTLLPSSPKYSLIPKISERALFWLALILLAAYGDIILPDFTLALFFSILIRKFSLTFPSSSSL